MKSHDRALSRSVAGVCLASAMWCVMAEAGEPPRLLFSASYDRQSETAEFAGGNPASLNFSRTLQYLPAPGVVGAGFQTEDNERCDYAMAGNFDPRQGTLSLWVRLENWRPREPVAYAFFAAEIPGRYRCLLYKPADAAEVVLEVRTGDRIRDVRAPVADWRPGEWHKVDAAWSPDRLWLTIDGEPVAVVLPDHSAQPPAADGTGTISVNPNNYFGDPPDAARRPRVSVDELRIHDRPLDPEPLRRDYAAGKALLLGGAYRQPLVTIPRRTGNVTPDGRFAPGEWDTAARIPLLALRGGTTPAPRQAAVLLQYDHRCLYVGFHATGGTAPLARHTARDSAVWEDGALEFAWHTGAPSNAAFHVAINSLNALYDSRNNATEWDGIQHTAAGTNAGGWIAELALPFEDLGVAAPAPGTSWAGNFMHDWDQRAGGYSTWSVTELPSGGGGFVNVDTYGTLAFGAEAPAVRLDSLGELPLGRVRAGLALAGGAGAPSWTADFRLATGQADPVVATFPLPPGGLALFDTTAPVGREALLAIDVADGSGQIRFRYDQPFQVKPPITLSYLCWPLRHTLDVELDMSNMDEESLASIKRAEFRGTLALLDSAGGRRGEQVIVPTNRIGRWTLPLPEDLPAGRYTVEARFATPAGEQVQSRALEIPDSTPLASTLGADSSVPAPWVPLRSRDGVVSVLNRSYTLGGSPFPVAMTSLGETVLDRPVEWVVATTSGPETVVWTLPAPATTNDDRIVLRGSGTAPRSGLTATYEATVDFDGLWLATVTLAPVAGPLTIESLQLRLAVNSGSAAHVLAPLTRPWREDRVLLDLFDHIEGAASSTAPVGHFWLTGLRTGLHVFTPTDGNWVYQPGKPNVRLDRGPERTEITMLLIHKPTTLSRPARYTLGLTATPARPQPRRTWYSGDHEWIFQPGKWRSWISLVPTDADLLRRGVREKRERGFKFLYQYSCAFVLGDNSPYEDFWAGTWALRSQPSAGKAFGGCPNSTLRNVIVTEVERLAREFGVGPYFDMFGVEWCNNREHGCGYTDSFGREARTSTLPGLRDEMMRIYRLAQQYDCRVFSHNHSLFVVPVHSFSHEWLPGEQYTALLAGKQDRFYSQLVPRTDYQAEMNPFTHGIQMVFLPQFARAAQLSGDRDFAKWFDADRAWASEQLLAMLLPHDIACSPANMAAGPVERVAEVFRRRGIALRADDPRPDALFTGYWAGPPVTVDDPALLLSTYRRPDTGDVLAVLSNPTPEARTGFLAVDGAALGWNRPPAMRDEYRAEDLPGWRERGLAVSPGTFRLLWIRPPQGGLANEGKPHP